MTRSMTWKEIAGVLAVLLVLVGLPVVLWHWRNVTSVRRYPAGTKIITLTAVAKGGVWTQDDVVGLSYWWRKPTRTGDIPLNQGDHVVVRLRSADVLHSFAIPLLRLGPVDIPAGHTVDVEFDATQPGILTFLCLQVCSLQHQGLHGRFVVKGNGQEETW
jgi:heme/copper-type cytochrome/quinol oxidase subunit 2